MAILKSFLCLCNTRTGSLVSGCYTLTISLVCLVYYLFRYVGHKLVEDSAGIHRKNIASEEDIMENNYYMFVMTEYKGIIYVGFVLYGFMIVSSLVIIPGVQLDKRYLLLPWIYIIILMVLYDTGSVALLTTVHMEREKTLHVWEIIWVFFYLFRLAANCYCFTCVVSQYQELSDGRGTYDYLYKPRRRARLRNGSQFDLETYDLPFGVHLPPYREEDHTENNPPAYETIYPQAETSIPTDSGESEYAEIEINQTASNLTEYVSHIGNHSYPLPVDENDYHGTLEILDQLTDNRHINSSPNDLVQSSSISRNSNSFDNHQGNSGCCHSDVIYHYPYCPRHSQHLHHHHHHLHDIYDHHHYNHHQNTTGDHQRFEHVTNDRSCKRNRNSQSYEVTVNIEWI